MKKMIFSLVLSVISSIGFSQDFEIDVSGNFLESEITIKAGTYNFLMANVDVNQIYKVSAIKENFKISKLETPSNFRSQGILTSGSNKVEIGSFELFSGEVLKILIDVYKVTTDANGKVTETKLKTFKYNYETKRRGEWRTTFGFNFVYMTKQDTYFSKDNNDDTYTISEGSNRKKFEYYPTLMFTWLPNKYFKKNKNFHLGLSGGIGYDFDTSLSVFIGPSIVYNENITISIGGAFHNQDRLLSQYSDGQIIAENLTFDQLHEAYIRFNPYVSISFRLDNNPFKK